jgi:hypothetical protein
LNQTTTSQGGEAASIRIPDSKLARDAAQLIDSQRIWFAIALHTTNGISPQLFSIAALLPKAPTWTS